MQSPARQSLIIHNADHDWRSYLSSTTRSLDIPRSSQASSCKGKRKKPITADCFQPIVYHDHTVIAEILQIEEKISSIEEETDKK